MGSFRVVNGIITDGLAFGGVRKWFCAKGVLRKRSFTRTFVFSFQVSLQHTNIDNPHSQPYHPAPNYHASYRDHHPPKNPQNSYNFYY